MASGARPGSLVPPRVNGTVFPGLVPPDGPKVESCTRLDTHYDIIIAAVVTVSIAFGILYTFFGYRCFKTIMFLTGFIFAFGIVYLICLQGELMPPYGNAGVSVLAGVLFGLITMLVQYVGLFITGLHTGLLLGLACLIIADHFVDTSPNGSVWLCVGILLCAALLVAILNLYFRKSLTILFSSLYGGCMLSVAMDYFLEKLSMVYWTWQRVSLKPVQPPPCWFSWIVTLCSSSRKKDSSDGQGECSTLQSDATHLTILPDAQLAALTESEDDSQTEIATRR
ncbi:hypothetical protein NQ317_018551 [Molorchus minor]|uniref:Transmembrane protein 198 n=1 Tax=Molorchus minor TaxID=1323400 RepID=A0ABQ9JW16_9CUCU|nr:hypothetical protein NQ317_018551 [Molorchus minor]